MAYNFPNSPSNGDTVTVNSVTYTYNSTLGAWKTTASSVGELNDLTDVSASSGTDGQVLTVQSDGTFAFEDASGGGGGGASVTTSDTAPASPSAGDLWWNSSDGKMYVYYTDADSSQWVSVSVAGAAGSGGGVTTYSSYSAFPSVSEASDGALAFASDTGALYVFDGSEWDRIAAGSDETPVITTDPASSHELNSDGSTSTVTMVAEDPEGFDIEYGIAYKTSESRGLGSNGLPVQITGTSINQSTGVYTFTPSTTSGDAGSFTARLSASDGVKMTTRTVSVELDFGIAIDLLMVAGGGGGGASGAGGGGGGGGGVITKSASSFSWSGSTSISIGSGGSYPGVTGGNTTGFGMTALGGGGSNTSTTSSGDVDGKDGGSGGGGQAFGNGAGGSALQPSSTDGGLGYAGGTGASSAGGGGGAGGAGGNPAGGAGYTWVNGSTYAAGGNGWNGSNEGVSGGANTGNGGNFHGGAGGSGIVIVRYSGTTQLATGGTITTSGGYTYHTFTSSGTFTVT